MEVPILFNDLVREVSVAFSRVVHSASNFMAATVVTLVGIDKVFGPLQALNGWRYRIPDRHPPQSFQYKKERKGNFPQML